jgi:hypothetical protein
MTLEERIAIITERLASIPMPMTGRPEHGPVYRDAWISVGADAPLPRFYIADADMLIPRPDLGPTCSTFVAKGDRIPPEAVPFL